MTIKLLYLTREHHPSFRPDLTTLFGKALPQLGVHTDLLASGQQDGVQPWGGGQAYVKGGASRWSRIAGRYRAAFGLFTLPRHQHYDAIQVRDRILGGLIGLIAARWHRLPFFYWMSFPFPESWLDLGDGMAASNASFRQRLQWRWRGKLASLILYRIVMPRARHVFVQSEAMREMLVAHGVPRDRMTPVPMGVALPPALETVVPSNDPRLHGRKIIAYLGALELQRHPEIMIEAMALVVNQQPKALLVLVGDSQNPGERAWLEGEVDRLGLRDHVMITGWMAPAEAWRYLRAAAVGLSPFPRTRVLEVASPTKVCEYLGYGVPVIGNDQPDQARLIAQTQGGLCVPLTAAGFAQGILQLLADPVRAAEMARQGRQAIVGLRSYDVLASQLAAQYRRLLG